MGQKVHPHGFRLGYIYDWNSKWFAHRDYPQLVQEDLTIRSTISRLLPDAGISAVDIERNANLVTVTVHTARPGIVIGRGGQRVDELRAALEQASGRKIRVNISEVRIPETDAALVARTVADQLERRISHRRAIKQAMSRAMQRGAQGVRIKVSGRLGGADMSRKDQGMEGRVPLHTLRADIDYGTAEAHTTLGLIGVKVWVYKGDRVQEEKGVGERWRPEIEGAAEAPTEEAASGEAPAGAAAQEQATEEAAAAPTEEIAAEPEAEPQGPEPEPEAEPAEAEAEKDATA